jgi:hypothetical protein
MKIFGIEFFKRHNSQAIKEGLFEVPRDLRWLSKFAPKNHNDIPGIEQYLQKCKELECGWNSYSAPPLFVPAVDRMLAIYPKILQKLESLEPKLVWFAPCDEGIHMTIVDELRPTFKSLQIITSEKANESEQTEEDSNDINGGTLHVVIYGDKVGDLQFFGGLTDDTALSIIDSWITKRYL